MTNFKKGNKVNFKRNALVFGKKISIIAVVPKQKDENEQMYIVENSYGWSAVDKRKEQFGLQDNKKYLFVSESELTAI